MPVAELQRLQEKHFVIMDLLMQGRDQKEIARMRGMSEGGIGLIVRSDLFQGELARRRAEVERKNDEGVAQIAIQAKGVIEGAALVAANRMRELVDSEDGGLQFKAATNILDRVFGPTGSKEDRRPVIKIEGNVLINLQRAYGEAFEGVEVKAV